jgi:hypothetical protein
MLKGFGAGGQAEAPGADQRGWETNDLLRKAVTGRRDGS